MKNQNTIQKIAKTQKILRKAKLILTALAVMMTALTGTVFAADPLGTINSLSDFIFSAIKATAHLYKISAARLSHFPHRQKIISTHLK